MKTHEISPRRAAQNAAFQALPIAKVIRPLRFVFEAHNVNHKRNHDAAISSLPHMVAHAVKAAKRGDGRTVQTVALSSATYAAAT